MMDRGRAPWLMALGVCLAIALIVAVAAVPEQREKIERAAEERELTIYSNTDLLEVAPLLEAFRHRYPFLAVRYVEVDSVELYQRVLKEADAGIAGADLLWGSSMDLQIKLVNDGYAQAYASDERASLPAWAVWKNEAYGTTAEPVVFAYNNRLLAPRDVPRSHAHLLQLLRERPDVYRGRVAALDPAKSAVGYLNLTQDLQTSRDTWKIVRALGSVDASLHATNKEILDQLRSGKKRFAYGVLASYALDAAAHDPSITVVAPSDYTLVISRIAIIPAHARHVNASRLFLDFMLSREGQSLLSRRFLSPVRADVEAPAGPRPIASALRPIRVGPALLVYLDQLKRQRLLKEWQSNFGGAALHAGASAVPS